MTGGRIFDGSVLAARYRLTITSENPGYVGVIIRSIRVYSDSNN
jgi:hypothetical protein